MQKEISEEKFICQSCQKEVESGGDFDLKLCYKCDVNEDLALLKERAHRVRLAIADFESIIDKKESKQAPCSALRRCGEELLSV